MCSGFNWSCNYFFQFKFTEFVWQPKCVRARSLSYLSLKATSTSKSGRTGKGKYHWKVDTKIIMMRRKNKSDIIIYYKNSCFYHTEHLIYLPNSKIKSGKQGMFITVYSKKCICAISLKQAPRCNERSLKGSVASGYIANSGKHSLVGRQQRRNGANCHTKNTQELVHKKQLFSTVKFEANWFWRTMKR